MDAPLTLDTLLARCGIGRYMEGIWFNGAILKGNELSVGGEDVRGFVERQWGSALREHLPELVIRVKSTRQELPKPSKPSIYNKRGQAYMAKRLGGMD